MACNVIECGYLGGDPDVSGPIDIGQLIATADGGFDFQVLEMVNMLPRWRSVVRAAGSEVMSVSCDSHAVVNRGGRGHAYLWGGVVGLAAREVRVGRRDCPLTIIVSREGARHQLIFASLPAQARAWVSVLQFDRANLGLPTVRPEELLVGTTPDESSTYADKALLGLPGCYIRRMASPTSQANDPVAAIKRDFELTQKEVADLLGVGTDELATWSSNGVPIEHAERVASVCRTAEILNGKLRPGLLPEVARRQNASLDGATLLEQIASDPQRALALVERALDWSGNA